MCQEFRNIYNKWDKWFPGNMPKAVNRKCMRTSTNSTLMRTMYESEDIAKQTKKVVQGFFQSGIGVPA